MKPKYLPLLLIFFSTILYAQEPQLIRWSQVKDGEVENRLIKKGDRFYLNQKSVSYPEVNDNISDITIDSFYMSINEDGEGLFPRSALMLEYRVGQGFVDYDLVNHTFSIDGFDVEEKYKAFTFDSDVKSINSNLYIEADLDTLPAEHDPFIGDHSVVVIDGETDSLLFIEGIVGGGAPSGFEDVILQGDFLYVISHAFYEYTFMDIIQHTYLEHTELGGRHEKVLHKVNWRTKELVWTRNFGTDYFNDEIYDFRLIQDSFLILALETSGQRFWEGERVDVPDGPNAGFDLAFYKISLAGELIDYIDIDSWGAGLFFNANIEDDGSILAYGRRGSSDPILFGDTGAFVEGGEGDAILGYAPADWKNIWTKSYPGEFFRGISGANYSVSDDELVIAIFFYEDITIDGTLFEASHAGQSENPNAGIGDIAFVIYDDKGDIKYSPTILPNDLWIFEVHKIGDQHYLLYGDYNSSDYIELFGDQLGENGDFLYSRLIFEIKGEWLDIVNGIDDLVNNIYAPTKIYPNPTSPDRNVILSIESLTNDVTIEIISLGGSIIDINDFIINEGQLSFQIPNLSQGTYVVTVKTDKNLFYSKLVIQ